MRNLSFVLFNTAQIFLTADDPIPVEVNRCLDFATETDYLHILHADDYVSPTFYEVMSKTLEDCSGFGMAWCLDERVDDKNATLSVSGKADGRIQVLDASGWRKGAVRMGVPRSPF